MIYHDTLTVDRTVIGAAFSDESLLLSDGANNLQGDNASWKKQNA
jgi:hypothetical protein